MFILEMVNMNDILKHNLEILIRDSDDYFHTGEMYDECLSEKENIIDTIKKILEIGDIKIDRLDDLINTDSDIYDQIQEKIQK